MSTLFTKIIKGDIPCYKIAEDDHNFAFLDINPLTKGHTLVIPKVEEDYIFNLNDEDLKSLICFAKKIAQSISNHIKCNRVAMVVLGMEVPHVHIHLIPIDNESDVDFSKEKLRLTKDEFLEIQHLIEL